jgi:hypothetical protein
MIVKAKEKPWLALGPGDRSVKRLTHHSKSLRQELETAASSRLTDSLFQKHSLTLAARLDGKGTVGEAFRKVSRAGCNASDLKRWLLKLQSELQMYSYERQRSHFTVDRRKKLERIAADLEYAAKELGGEAGIWIFLLGDLRGDIMGPTPAREALDLVRKLALVTRKAIPSLGGVATITASLPITAIVGEVRRRTGRPHYPQMAILIGSACGLSDFGEEHLKMLIARRKR